MLAPMSIAFDTLKYARRLRDAGFPADQAEAMAEAQNEALRDTLDGQVATKADILKLDNKLSSEIQAVDSNLRAEIQAVDSNLRAEIQAVEARLDIKFERTNADSRLLKWMLGVVMVAVVIPLIRDVLL